VAKKKFVLATWKLARLAPELALNREPDRAVVALVVELVKCDGQQGLLLAALLKFPSVPIVMEQVK
jgi:hypothetical protein